MLQPIPPVWGLELHRRTLTPSYENLRSHSPRIGGASREPLPYFPALARSYCAAASAAYLAASVAYLAALAVALAAS